MEGTLVEVVEEKKSVYTSKSWTNNLDIRKSELHWNKTRGTPSRKTFLHLFLDPCMVFL